MTALTLCAELAAPVCRPGRAAELGRYVEEWCAIEQRVSSRVSSPAAGEAAARRQVSEVEAMLLEVGSLAESLSLTNVTTSAQWSARRVYTSATFALANFKGGLQR